MVEQMPHRAAQAARLTALPGRMVMAKQLAAKVAEKAEPAAAKVPARIKTVNRCLHCGPATAGKVEAPRPLKGMERATAARAQAAEANPPNHAPSA
jgi:hypothetical protein